VTLHFKSSANHSSGNLPAVLRGTTEVITQLGRLQFQRYGQQFSAVVPDGGGWQSVTITANFPGNVRTEEPAEVRVRTGLYDGSVTFGKVELSSSNGVIIESQPVIEVP
jgi:hypothetical protein